MMIRAVHHRGREIEEEGFVLRAGAIEELQRAMRLPIHVVNRDRWRTDRVRIVRVKRSCVVEARAQHVVPLLLIKVPHERDRFRVVNVRRAIDARQPVGSLDDMVLADKAGEVARIVEVTAKVRMIGMNHRVP